jgi:hypothetical protein
LPTRPDAEATTLKNTGFWVAPVEERRVVRPGGSKRRREGLMGHQVEKNQWMDGFSST